MLEAAHPRYWEMLCGVTGALGAALTSQSPELHPKEAAGCARMSQEAPGDPASSGWPGWGMA